MNESGVYLPPPNPHRLEGITFVEVTGAVDVHDMDVDTNLSLSSGAEYLPGQSISHRSSTTPVLPPMSSMSPAAGKHDWPSILVIDDSSSIRRTWVGMMKKKGYEVIECENGEQGFGAMKAKVFSFVVIDMQMPLMDGVQTTTSIREHERLKGKTGKDQQVIVFCSGGMGAELEQKAKSAGADIVGPKPSPVAQLFEEAIRLRGILDSSD